ncbi:MAG: hypothetical protein ACOC2N_00820 [Spirochaetota bacterium]
MPLRRSAETRIVSRTICAVLLLLVPIAAFAEDVVTTSIDWSTGTLLVTVERPVEAAGARGPAAVSQTQRAIRNDAPAILLPVLGDLPFDSRHSVGSLLETRERLIAALERVATKGTPVDARATTDLRSAIVTFRLDLYADLGVEFISHSRPIPIRPQLGWIPQKDYTGILIYAADTLPVFGTTGVADVEPTLFPGIYYTAGPEDLLYRLSEAEYVDPARLASGGPGAYTADVAAAGLAHRIGSNPLRILAIGTFGTNPTDIVISEADARLIRASQHNRSLLQQGRLVIVVDAERL